MESKSYKIIVRSLLKKKNPIFKTPFLRATTFFPLLSPLNLRERGPFIKTKSSYSVFHILTTFILRKSLLIVPRMYSNKVKETQNCGVSISYG